jgi:hypothetical protein
LRVFGWHIYFSDLTVKCVFYTCHVVI